ncbi:PREDICTED: rhodanese-like domain-containing protein 10 [Tarenaya hassleriana]|uniref:rhodanese-like domain-containing protein 10 n=1 Tax=Tarenaya hassleriana TaxID=28532 RepID=UPI00053C363A|nr:PREDICTED: rhodanese-like domain-containing protein 10 [Tarenaya hassleriana]
MVVLLRQPNHIHLSSLFPSSRKPLGSPQVITAAAAGKRNGRELVLSGEVRAVEPKKAAEAVAAEGYVMLDVRPEWEREKARVRGSLHVPLFVEDTDNGPITLLKKWVHFGYIGLWTGQRFTTLNDEFALRVQEAVPDKESRVLVACGEGLRSLMAIAKLHEEGYKSMGWLAGGYNRAERDDFQETEGREELRFATVGGVSYYFLKLLLLFQTFSR